MKKMWEGRIQKKSDKIAEELNCSLDIDKRLYQQDITGSIAHAKMLAECGIIEKAHFEKIAQALNEILQDIKSGLLEIKNAEDIHMFVEAELISRIGDIGGMLHTARSRNDQVALDLRLYCKSEIEEISQLLKKLVATIAKISKENKDTLMCGYTHLQRAQPISLAHHLLAYAYMFLRDISRLKDCATRVDFSPLGCGALAGTTYPIDRLMSAKSLGFADIVKNSIDGVSDRDYVLELCFVSSMIMLHLSRFCEELILWCTQEFDFVELDDAFSTGSSIMPQKKNPDIAELIRGKSGRVFGNLVALLTMMKALPLAYNKDMQEDKEALFDSLDTIKLCLCAFDGMLSSIKIKTDNMAKSLEKGFVAATDLADYLAKKGVPFRSAYKTVGKIVAYCIEKNKVLNQLSLQELKTFDDLFESDVFDEIDLALLVEKRKSAGGPSRKSVEKQIEEVLEAIKE